MLSNNYVQEVDEGLIVIGNFSSDGYEHGNLQIFSSEIHRIVQVGKNL